jgi:catechol 2,3-dioxygenase-like lactoylglutathione lyase family enzyme
MHSLPEGEDRMPNGEPFPVFYSTVPQLACRDLEETLDYYRDVLGFEVVWQRDEPAESACMVRDQVRIFLVTDPELASRVRGQEIVLFVDELDRLFEEHQECGADIISDIHDEPGGLREYTIRDNNGYYLRVAEGVDELMF